MSPFRVPGGLITLLAGAVLVFVIAFLVAECGEDGYEVPDAHAAIVAA